MPELFDGWKFLAGLGTFIFGIFMLEESVKLIAGRSFKTLIRRYTGTRLRGLLTGLLTTAILQSSSAVSLIVLAFVGAGLVTLVNAIAVLMGAMVGTTFTAWIVALFGFTFKIDALALPLIGIGGLGLIVLPKSGRPVNLSKLLVSFGFLLLGLDYMKTSVSDLAGTVDIAALPDLGSWVYVLAGVVLTALMQSSSAVIAIVLTTLFSGLIDFTQAASVVIGANVGTTVTVLLGAIGGAPAKKQAALSSLAFNVGTAAVVYAALPWLVPFTQGAVGPHENAVLGIALFHTLFNVIGLVLFFPFIAHLARLLKRLVPERRTVLARFIPNTSPEVPEAAVAALRKEILNQFTLSLEYVARRHQLAVQPPGGNTANANERPRRSSSPAYADLERLHAEIFTFYARTQSEAIDEQEAVQLESLIRASRGIMNAARNLNDVRAELEELERDDNAFMQEVRRDFRGRLEQLATVAQGLADRDYDGFSPAELEDFTRSVEEADRRFISSCSAAVVRGAIREHEVTRLLMANRLITYASRMMVQSMEALAGEPQS
jgi:phosphate:Na+ symporter